MRAETKEAMQNLILAALKLEEEWQLEHSGALTKAYPSYLPDFQEVVTGLINWRDANIEEYY